MGIFDHLVSNINETAQKADLPADEVQAIAETLRDNLGDGQDHDSAIAVTAKQHCISVEKVRELLRHAGCPGF